MTSVQIPLKLIVYSFHTFATAAWLSLLIGHAGICSANRENLTEVSRHNHPAVVERAYNVDFDDDERRVRMLAAASQKLLDGQLPWRPASCLIRAANRAYRKLFSFDVVLLI